MSFSSKIWKTLSIWLKQTKLERFMIIKTWGVRIIFRLEINVKIRLVDICNFVIAVISGCWELLFYSLIDCIVNEGLSYVVIKSWVLSLLFYSKLDWKTLIPLLATLGFFSTCRNEVSVKSKVHSVVFFLWLFTQFGFSTLIFVSLWIDYLIFLLHFDCLIDYYFVTHQIICNCTSTQVSDCFHTHIFSYQIYNLITTRSESVPKNS